MPHLLACVLCLIPLLPVSGADGGDVDPWAAIDAREAAIDDLERRVREHETALEILREALPDAASAELAAAREALADAEAAGDAAHTAAGLDEVRARRDDAIAERKAAVAAVLADAEGFQEAVARHEAVQARRRELEADLAGLDRDALFELARLRREDRHLGRLLYGARKARWQHPDVKASFEAANERYHAYKNRAKKSGEYQAARRRAKQARKDLEKLTRELAPAGELGEEILAAHAELKAALDAAKKEHDRLRADLFAGASRHTVSVELSPKKGKERKPAEITLWIPPDCAEIRGVVEDAPKVGKFATTPEILEAAVREDLATMVFHGISFDGEASLAKLDEILAQLAEASGHPELRGAAVLTAGLSASVIQARNLAYVAPERVFGVVHIAGGNMHHHLPEGSLSGVPFFAHNGEYEWCGPEGGLRPEYGRQTQWLMIREQLLRRRRADPDHLMSLLVVPGGDHGHWDRRLAGMFVRKAARARLPADPGDGSQPVRCRELSAEDGWLIDARLDDPVHPPAPWADYAGEKSEAFWVFDEEMARALTGYHADRFVLPDPTDEFPVPESWPPKK